MAADETRDGIALSHLDEPLYDGAGVTKRDLVDYLDAVHERMLPVLRDRALSVIRARAGQEPFMQKNLPPYAPDWIPTLQVWAERSRREVRYPLCNERHTLLWFANQRAVEYHPALFLVGDWHHVTHLVLDLDPPPGDDSFGAAVRAAHLVRQALSDAGLAGAVKTSGAKGVHVFVPMVAGTPTEDVAAAELDGLAPLHAWEVISLPQVQATIDRLSRKRLADAMNHLAKMLEVVPEILAGVRAMQQAAKKGAK